MERLVGLLYTKNLESEYSCRHDDRLLLPELDVAKTKLKSSIWNSLVKLLEECKNELNVRF